MRHAYMVVLALLCIAGARSSAVTHTVVDAGFSFSPATLTINLGDTVVFSISPAHNVVEVTQTTWNNNGNTSNGGFTLPFGGGTLVIGIVGTYYYVCSPHAAMGMKGQITVAQTSIGTGALATSSYCAGAALQVPFTATGTFNAGNTFTAQLSNATGSFAAPVVIGTTSGTTSGAIAATIPPGTTAGGGYRIRVVASNPVIVGVDNGTDITISTVPAATLTAGGATSFCDGQNVTLTANSGTGLTHTWRRNGVVIASALGSTYQATLSGLYTVEVSNGSCSATSTGVNVTVFTSNPTSFIWTAAQSTDWGTVGNWNSPCAVPGAGDTVIISGTVTPPASVPAVTLSRLVMNNAGGLTLGGALVITGGLELTQGHITLGGNDLELGSGAAITGGSASSFVVTNGTGELRQAGLGAGVRGGAVLFPVGATSASYTPLTVTNAGTADAIGVRVADGVRSGGTTGAVLVTDVVSRTWFITEGTAGGSNATLLFQWNTADESTSFDRSVCFVAHHDGTSWNPLGPLGAAAGGGPWQRSVSGVTSFSPFGIGDVSSPLPVDLRLFTAESRDGAVHLAWRTERERGVAGFALERRRVDVRSGMEESDTQIGFIAATGSDGHGAAYQFVDTPPAGGSWSYRLRMVDLDGRVEYSQAVLVDVDGVIAQPEIVSLSPQPLRAGAASAVELRYRTPVGAPVAISVHDALGRRVASLPSHPSIAGMNLARLDASSLPPGMYLVRLVQGDRLAQRRMVVVR